MRCAKVFWNWSSGYREKDENMTSEQTDRRDRWRRTISCLLYTSDAADDMQCVDLGGRRIIKKVRGCLGVGVWVVWGGGRVFFKQKTAYEM